MNDLTILHLSDLHIDDSKENYSRLLRKLLEDIEKEIIHTEDKTLVVAVTGDIIHQGKKKATIAALKFFKDLKTILGDKVVKIYIVPGNHDKYPTSRNQFLIPAYRMLRALNDNEFDKTFYDSFWQIQLETYQEKNGSGYLKLVEEIYKIFGQTDTSKKSYIKNTFGVDWVEIRGKKYCFVLLNTAWSCIDEKDNRNLVLGKFQLEEIKKQYSQLISDFNGELNPFALTFVMGHHPIGSLYGKEEDSIFSEMMGFEELNANAYLCGHKHDRTVINWVNNWHSLNTFMTGIGWPENKESQHVELHYYSFYVFNLDANSVDIYVRATNDNGNFFPDFRIYTTNETAVGKKKIVFPIKSQLAQAFVSLGTAPNRSAKAYYISEDFMCIVRRYSMNMARLCQSAGNMIEADKNDLFENIVIDKSQYQKSFFDEKNTRENNIVTKDIEEIDPMQHLYNYLFANILDEQISKIVFDILEKNKKILFDMFLGFLQKICQKIQTILFDGLYAEEDVVRVHFRYLTDRKVFNYTMLCLSFPDNIDPNDYELSDRKYGELIEAAHQVKKPLIYSVNKELCENALKSKWANFITVIPEFVGNSFTRTMLENKKKSIPFITFGVTSNSEKFDKVLYCMDFFSIDVTLKEMIDQYLNIFKINVNEFCSWVKEEKRKENY